MAEANNSLLLASLCGSALLSLLISAAMVMIFVLRQRERAKKADDESFKALAVRGSQRHQREAQQHREERSATSHTASLQLQLQQPTALLGKKIDATLLASSVSKSRQCDASVSVEGSQVSTAEAQRTKKLMDVLKWREEHARTFNGSLHRLNRNRQPPQPPLPTVESTAVAMGSCETGSEE